MKDINPTPPAATAPVAFVTETIDRYLGGLTTLAEEQQLRSTLEAQEAQGAILNDDERAALALLRLTFPEEDAAALLTEDLSHEYEVLAAKRHQAVTPHIAAERQSTSRHLHLPHFTFRRIAAVIATAAAVLALILVLGKRQREDDLIARSPTPSSPTPSRPTPDPSREGGEKTLSPLPREGESLATLESSQQAGGLPSLTGGVGDGSPEKPMTPSLPKEDAVTPAYEDPDGAAILAAEQQRILEVEQAARQRAIAVTQENTLACVTAASPS